MSRSGEMPLSPFDTIDAVVAAKAKIFLKAQNGIWTAYNLDGKLSRYAYLTFPRHLTGRKTLVACSKTGASLNVDAALHHIATDFPEMPNVDCAQESQLVAVEDQWQWHFDFGQRKVFFKARAGQGWVRTKRLLDDGRFADDVAISMLAYGKAIYVATHMGILRFDLNRANSDEKTISVNKILIPEGVQELKNVEGTLYSLTGESKVMRLDSGGRWGHRPICQRRRFF